jgi:signal transduction histidine kinase
MIRSILRKIIFTELSLLIFFNAIGYLYVVYTLPLNPVQFQWVMAVAAWETVALGVISILLQPFFRGIYRRCLRMEAGESLTPEELPRFLRKLLSYPVRAAIGVFLATVFGYGLGALQIRYFADLSWEGVVITLICGTMSGMLWATVEYFMVEYQVRPLTAVGRMAEKPVEIRTLPLSFKIFACSLALVMASLGFFGIMAYTRAARILESQVAEQLRAKVIEVSNLTAELPPTDTGELSDIWWALATEYRVSPRGYLHLIDPEGKDAEGNPLPGKLLRTHPATDAYGKTSLRDEGFFPEIYKEILARENREGSAVDRVGSTRIISYIVVPDSRFKLVAVAPRSDFSATLEQFVQAGLAAIGFSLVVVLGIGFLTARSITTSISEVTKAARSVAGAHDLSQRVEFLTNDEVGVLSTSFNEMAHNLQTYAEGLEKLVAQRTRELQFRGEQLEAKNVEMRDFLYVVSHDLRAPLINLEGFSRALQDAIALLNDRIAKLDGGGTDAVAELVEEWPATHEEVSESVGFILQGVKKMDMLAKALLELSRIETRPHMPQHIDTPKMISDILGSLQFQISQRGIAVEVGDLPPVMGDPVRLNQVFANLIDNAIKYMKAEGDKRIEVGCSAAEDFYQFYVRDTGPGIRPEDQQKIFRLFTRLVTNTIPGDGVGLAAVRKIVEKHGGKIWIESTLGEGSTFWVSIPRPVEESEQQSSSGERREDDVRAEVH